MYPAPLSPPPHSLPPVILPSPPSAPVGPPGAQREGRVRHPSGHKDSRLGWAYGNVTAVQAKENRFVFYIYIYIYIYLFILYWSGE
eukprot:gene8298-5815_t